MADDPDEVKRKKLTVAQVLGLEPKKAPTKLTQMRRHLTPTSQTQYLEPTLEARAWMAEEAQRKAMLDRAPKAPKDDKVRNLRKHDISMYIKKDGKTKDDDFEK